MPDRSQCKEQLRGCLVDYLGQKGLNPRKPFSCLNPEHPDRHPSMSFNPHNNTVHCFSCGVTYDLFDLIGMDYHLDGFEEKLQKGCELFHLPYCPPAAAPAAARRAAEPAAADETGDFTAQIEEMRAHSEGLAYFVERGIPEELCKANNLFTYDGRAYLPVYEGGRCVSYCARALQEETQPRYRNSTGPMGIWGAGMLLEEPSGVVFVCEGIFDALSVEALGYRAVALCGASNVQKFVRFCEEHIERLGGVRFLAAGDGDEAGRRMNAALCEALGALHLPCGVFELEEGGDLNALLCANRAGLQARLEQVAVDDRTAYLRTSAAASLPAFWESINRRNRADAISTGFSQLDGILDGGFYSGLYVLGAISSLGKTSLMLQIADHISRTQCDVLFFSLEMSRYELMAKSLSRLSWQCDRSPGKTAALTARQILKGEEALDPQQRALLRQAEELYTSGRETGLYLREGIADIGTAEIREAVRSHLEHTGNRPVVMIDYLQILRPADLRATDKQNIDRNVVELKRISRDFNIPVVAISSFNRDNYRNAASMEAFKESGAVEYSSDVLFGLQLCGAGEAGLDLNAQKVKVPRPLELVMLKNRNGIPFAKLRYDYYAKFSCFEELPPRSR